MMMKNLSFYLITLLLFISSQAYCQYLTIEDFIKISSQDISDVNVLMQKKTWDFVRVTPVKDADDKAVNDYVFIFEYENIAVVDPPIDNGKALLIIREYDNVKDRFISYYNFENKFYSKFIQSIKSLNYKKVSFKIIKNNGLETRYENALYRLDVVSRPNSYEVYFYRK